MERERRTSRRARTGGAPSPRALVDAARAQSSSELETVIGSVNSRLCKLKSDVAMEMRVEGSWSSASGKGRKQKQMNMLRWAVDLAERTVGAMHADCWGWDERSMLKELQSPAALLLVVSATPSQGKRCSSPPSRSSPSSSSEDVAYCHFRFDTECGDAVLYLYEMHVEPQWQGFGLGRAMMNALLALAKHTVMNRVLLTVFVANTAASAFYAHLGFAVDKTCPSMHGQADECKYRIMSLHV